MAQRFQAFTVTVPAGTAIAAPQTTDVSFNAGTVTQIEIIIPDGHAGFTGIAIGQANQQIIPEATGTYFVGNDDRIPLAVADFLDNGNWQAICYNTDIYDHNFYLRFWVDENSASTQVAAFATGSAVVVGAATSALQIDTGTAAASATALGLT